VHKHQPDSEESLRGRNQNRGLAVIGALSNGILAGLGAVTIVNRFGGKRWRGSEDGTYFRKPKVTFLTSKIDTYSGGSAFLPPRRQREMNGCPAGIFAAEAHDALP
jgi:hypothetical protein